MIDRRIALAAARLVITGENADAFQQCRFAGTVLADDDGNGAIESEREIVVQEWQAERIGFAIRNERGLKPDTLEVWRRQVDAIST
jgi:hypothetical protein